MRAMESCIYRGHVEHRRLSPVRHDFHYGMSWLYLDLEETDQLVRSLWLLSQRRFALASFCRDDHLGGGPALLATVREFIRQESGESVSGPVRLLTQLRQFSFSPDSSKQ